MKKSVYQAAMEELMRQTGEVRTQDDKDDISPMKEAKPEVKVTQGSWAKRKKLTRRRPLFHQLESRYTTQIAGGQDHYDNKLESEKIPSAL